MKGTRLRAQRSDSIRGEAPWIPRGFEDLERLRRRLDDAGYPAPVVNGVTGWLLGKALGEEDVTAQTTRSRYRKILRDLGPAPLADDEPKRWFRPRRVAA